MESFYEIRVESDDINFIMWSDTHGIEACVDFYRGKHNGSEFFKRVHSYCVKHGIAVPQEIEGGFALVQLKAAHANRLEDYLCAMDEDTNDFENYAPLVTITIGGGKPGRPSFSKGFTVEFAAESNALDDAFDTLIDGFFDAI